jgi:adenosylcobinamide-GDP ribazoletransferase
MDNDSTPRAWLDDLRLAIAFSTRLRFIGAGARSTHDPGQVRRALRLAPLAGVLVALVVAAVFAILDGLSLPPLAAALLAMAAGFWVTGGLHEDGLADTADGLGAVASRARRLEIMRDSRVGTFGAVALVLSFGLRAVALGEIEPGAAALAALVAAHALSRALFLPAMMLTTPARTDGLSGGLTRPRQGEALVAIALGLGLAVVALGPAIALACAVAAAIVGAVVVLIARAKLGGYTGDVLGALQQVSEMTLLLTIASLS